METETPSEVFVPASIENLYDVERVRRGLLDESQVRRIDVRKAKVDRRESILGLPRHMIEQLGLRQYTSRKKRTPEGIVEIAIHDAVTLRVQERHCTAEVFEVADDSPVLIGFILLDMLDFVVDFERACLVGNPAHDGEWMIDMFWFNVPLIPTD